MGALVVTRKPEERIRVTCAGNVLWIIVSRVKGEQVRLAFVAPPDVSILREELLPAEEHYQAVTAEETQT